VTDSLLDLASRNSAELWRRLAGARAHRIVEGDGYVSVDAAPDRGGLRVVVTERVASPRDLGTALTSLLAESTSIKVTVEDAYGNLDLSGTDLTKRRLAVMVCPAGTPMPRTPQRAVSDTDLAAAERVIVDGFPSPAFQPYRSGEMLPPTLLGELGIHLLRDEGVPAAACCSFDDGNSVGLYWVVVLADHRGRGLGRAVVQSALAAAPGRPFVLTATDAGRPLYASLGFDIVGEATWWVRAPAPPA
jgi:GNAT superfamily N-acetyltransferase